MKRVTVRKAVTAATVGLAGALGVSLADGALTVPETLMAVGVGLTAYAATWRVPYYDTRTHD